MNSLVLSFPFPLASLTFFLGSLLSVGHEASSIPLDRLEVVYKAKANEINVAGSSSVQKFAARLTRSDFQFLTKKLFLSARSHLRPRYAQTLAYKSKANTY